LDSPAAAVGDGRQADKAYYLFFVLSQ